METQYTVDSLVDIINQPHIIEWKQCLLKALFTDFKTTNVKINNIASNFIHNGDKQSSAVSFFKSFMKSDSKLDNEISDFMFEHIFDKEHAGNFLMDSLQEKFGNPPDFVEIYKSSVREFLSSKPSVESYIAFKKYHPEFEKNVNELCDFLENVHGSYEPDDSTYELFDKYMFLAAAELNDFDNAKFLFENTKFSIHDVQYDAFKHFCLHNNLDAAKWIFSICIPVKNWINLTQGSGNPIYENGEINIYYGDLFETCCEKGFLDIVIWMDSVASLKSLPFLYTKHDSIEKACTTENKCSRLRN